MRIDSSGNVAIGIASTGNKFHVEGTTTGSRFGVDVSASGVTCLAATNESNADVELVIFDGRSSIGSSVNIPIAFHTNGKTNERMRLTTSGELLVGMSNSQAVAGGSAKIQVQSNDSTGRISIVQHRNEASGAPFLSLGKTRATATNNVTLVQNGDTLGTVAFAGGDGTDIQSSAAQIVCQVDGTPGSNDMPGRLLFFTTPDGSDSPAERMRIDSAGKVGIGTTSPSCTGLNVAVNTATTSRVSENTVQIQNSNNSASTCAGIVLAASSGSNSEFNIVTQKHSSGSGAEFHLDNGTNARMQMSGDNGDIKFGVNGTMITTFTPGNANNTTGIGIEPRNGSIFLSRGDGACLRTNINQTDTDIVQFAREGTLRGRVFMQTTTVSYATSSDYRLKENQVLISDGITRLKTLKPYRFNFIEEPSKTVDGFFAHEVTAVPEAVVGAKDETKDILYTKDDTIPEGKSVGDIKETVPEYQSLDYGRITPLLTAALQEAISKIEVLETEVAALKAA